MPQMDQNLVVGECTNVFGSCVSASSSYIIVVGAAQILMMGKNLEEKLLLVTVFPLNF